MSFESLRLAEPILHTLIRQGYNTPTPIQAQAIPPALEGRDVLGCAQTGTGKTAAFALPIIQRLAEKPARDKRRPIRALILSPTRELAAQISESFRVYGHQMGLRHTEVFGGVSQNPQTRELRQGVDVLIATPGRLIDLMNQGFIDLSRIETFVLDEADRMLDMGFAPDIRRVSDELPAKRQTLLFSATMPKSIRQLANAMQHQAVEVSVAPDAPTAERIEQTVYHVEKRSKPALLSHVLTHLRMTRTLVFSRTKHGADRIVRDLRRTGVRAEAIHGNKSQNVRQRALANFRADKTPVLVATDVAARGIDVDDISHVVNFDLPNEAETYVHRIGRTGRAGATGVAISFCDASEQTYLRAIEKLTRQPITISTDAPMAMATAPPATAPARQGQKQGQKQGRGQASRSNQGPRSRASGTRSSTRSRGKTSAPAGGSSSRTRPRRNSQRRNSA